MNSQHTCLHQSTNKCLAKANFSGNQLRTRPSREWEEQPVLRPCDLPSALGLQEYIGLETAPTHPVDHSAFRQQKYHMPISEREKGMGRRRNLIFCLCHLTFFSINPRELMSHFQYLRHREDHAFLQLLPTEWE